MNLGAVVARPGGEIADFRSFLLLRGQYRIDDNWHVAGLKGTGSKDIVVDAVVRPRAPHAVAPRLRDRLAAARPGAATTARCTACRGRSCSTWRSPRPCSARPGASSTRGSPRPRDRAVAGVGRLADDPLTQRRLAEAAWDLDAAVTVLRADADEMWETAEAGDTRDDGRSGRGCAGT